MTAGLVVFSRLDSSRLPGKALLDLGGRPLLGRVLDRVRLVDGANHIIVATTDRRIDDPIAAFAAREKVDVFRGATTDVLGRCLGCADEFGFDLVVRISGDSPFLPPELAASMIQLHRRERGAELTTNVHPRTYPSGASVEVIAIEALREVSARTDDEQDREYVTRYIYSHPEEFRIRNVAASKQQHRGITLALDTEEDLARSRWMIDRMTLPAHLVAFGDLVELARCWNAGHGRSGVIEASYED